MQAIKKRLIFIVFLALINQNAYEQSRAVKKAEKAKQEKAEQQEKDYNEKQEALRKHQYNIQAKSVKKRMDKNRKVTDKYYKKKLRQTLWQKLTQCFKKKKYGNKKSNFNKKNKKKL